MEPKCCPTCGQTLPPDFPGAYQLSPFQLRILNTVRSAGQHGLTSAQLFERVYGDQSNGGPMSGPRSMHVIIHQMNKKLRAEGYAVRGERVGGGRVGIYKVVRLT
jgi:hypothetical protein